MNYCTKCKRAFQEEKCPGCGKSAKVRAKENDLCFLVEKQEMWAEMLADVLKQNGIPFEKKDEVESWVTVYTGSAFKIQSFYVPFAYLEQAQDLVDQLFANEEESAETSDVEEM